MTDLSKLTKAELQQSVKQYASALGVHVERLAKATIEANRLRKSNRDLRKRLRICKQAACDLRAALERHIALERRL